MKSILLNDLVKSIGFVQESKWAKTSTGLFLQKDKR